MSDATWTWLLFSMEFIGVSGMLLVGRRLWWGWLVVLVHSIPWFVYAVTHRKPGFVAMSFLWWTVHAYNAWRWSHPRQQGEPR
jgi:hypothetical protein